MLIYITIRYVNSSGISSCVHVFPLFICKKFDQNWLYILFAIQLAGFSRCDQCLLARIGRWPHSLCIGRSHQSRLHFRFYELRLRSGWQVHEDAIRDHQSIRQCIAQIFDECWDGAVLCDQLVADMVYTRFAVHFRCSAGVRCNIVFASVVHLLSMRGGKREPVFYLHPLNTNNLVSFVQFSLAWRFVSICILSCTNVVAIFLLYLQYVIHLRQEILAAECDFSGIHDVLVRAPSVHGFPTGWCVCVLCCVFCVCIVFCWSIVTGTLLCWIVVAQGIDHHCYHSFTYQCNFIVPSVNFINLIIFADKIIALADTLFARTPPDVLKKLCDPEVQKLIYYNQ